MRNSGLYLISSPDDISNEARVLADMMEAVPGLIVHLRKPGVTASEVEQILNMIPAVYHPRITVHYFPELLEIFDLKGWHFSPLYPNTSIRGALSRSVHAVDELRDNYAKYEYVFCSPVFDSISKPNYVAGAWNIEKESDTLRKKAVALGGISAQSISRARNSGFCNFAVLGSVWQSENPLSSLLSINNILKNEDR